VKRPLALAAALLMLAGCSSNTPGDLSASAARILQPQVEHVRQVAATHDYVRLQAAVDELKSLVEQERKSGDVSDSRAAAIDDAADVLLEDASPSPSPSPSTESPTPTPTTESPTPTPTPTPSETPTPVVSVSASNNGNGDGGGLPDFSPSAGAASQG